MTRARRAPATAQREGSDAGISLFIAANLVDKRTFARDISRHGE